MDISTSELLNFQHFRFVDFVIHNFIAKWQDKVPQINPMHVFCNVIVVLIFIYKKISELKNLHSCFFNFKLGIQSFFKNIPKDTILSCIDFFENYEFKT
jgi:hypothetical protein